MCTSKSTIAVEKLVSKYNGFADFIRNATNEDKEIVFKSVMCRVSEQQRAIIEKAQSIQGKNNEQ